MTALTLFSSRSSKPARSVRHLRRQASRSATPARPVASARQPGLHLSTSGNGPTGWKGAERRGTTTVEMALVLPIILMTTLAAVELNNLNFLRNSAAHAVYEGARAALVSGGTPQDGNNKVLDYLSRVGCGNGVVPQTVVTFDNVTVSVMIPYHQNSSGLSRFFGGYSIQKSITLRRESPSTADEG